jgi:hypothetical protein
MARSKYHLKGKKAKAGKFRYIRSKKKATKALLTDL